MPHDEINTISPRQQDIERLFALQQKARWSVAKTTAEERKAKLRRMMEAIRSRREAICEAIHQDFSKHPHESEITEVNQIQDDINHILRHLSAWMKPRRVPTPVTLFGSSSEIRYESKGLVLILSPWNYPFHAATAPFVAAVAAGNCVMLRPSEKTPHTARLLHDLIAELFPIREAAVVLGSHETADRLLDLPFDHFFFTGSTAVGRKIMAAAAKHLASVTLELGGKSPVVVDETADLAAAAERITWGKFINAGQTCVAPDYVLVHERIAESLAQAIKETVERSYGSREEQRLNCESFASLVDSRSLARLDAVLNSTVQAGAQVVIGGAKDEKRRRLSPTILLNVPPDAPIMREEIFGPVLPLVNIRSLEEAVTFIQARPKPLAMYIFSRSDANIDRLLSSTSSGGTAVNHVIMHLANPHLPFGGVGESGQGHYHGWFGFEAFSHACAVFWQKLPSGVKMIAPPYGERTRKGIRLLQFLRR